MTIYILGTPEETVQALDDKSLDKMIKYIAHVLQGCHQGIPEYWAFNNNATHLRWIYWARECKANYSYLVGLGIELLCEQQYRFFVFPGRKYKQIIMDWAYHNIPDLPEPDILSLPPNSPPSTPFPLVMPKKYINDTLDGAFGECLTDASRITTTVKSYRNYYQARVKPKRTAYMQNIHPFISGNQKILAWTRREKPEWLELS